MLLFLSSLNLVMSASNIKSDGERQDYPNRLDLSRLIKSQNVEDSYDALKRAISKIEYKNEFLSDSSDKGVKAKIQFLKKLLECEIINGQINFDEYNDEFIEPKELFSLLIKEELLDEIKYEVFKLNNARDAILKLRDLDKYLASFNKHFEELCRILGKLHLKLKNSKCLKLRLWDSKSFKLIVALKKEFNKTSAKYSGFENELKNFKKIYKSKSSKNTSRVGDQDIDEGENPVSSEHFMETIFLQEALKSLRDVYDFKINLDSNLKMIGRNLDRKVINDKTVDKILDALYEIQCRSYRIGEFIFHLGNEVTIKELKYMKSMNSESKRLFRYLLNEATRLKREAVSILRGDNVLELLCKRLCIVIEKNKVDILLYFEVKLSHEVKSSYEKTRKDYFEALKSCEKSKRRVEKLVENLVSNNFEDLKYSSGDLACLSLLSLDMSLDSDTLFKGLCELHKLLMKNVKQLKVNCNGVANDSLYPNLTKSIGEINEEIKGAKNEEIYFKYYGEASEDEEDLSDEENVSGEENVSDEENVSGEEEDN